MNKQITEHFSFDGDKMLTCSHCQAIKITDIFWKHMEMLEKVRVDLNWPIIINSGYRCPYYNRKIGGSKGSWHMRFATDVRPSRGAPIKSMEDWEIDAVYKLRLTELRKIAEDIGFTGIGTSEWFIHLDTRPTYTTWRG